MVLRMIVAVLGAFQLLCAADEFALTRSREPASFCHTQLKANNTPTLRKSSEAVCQSFATKEECHGHDAPGISMKCEWRALKSIACEVPLNCGEYNNTKVCNHSFTTCDVCDTWCVIL
jgi:hypothetical protein